MFFLDELINFYNDLFLKKSTSTILFHKFFPKRISNPEKEKESVT